MAKVKNAQAFAEKYARRAAAAVPDYKAGIESVTVSPGQKAVANADGYINGVQQNFDKWKAKTGAIKLEDWKAPALDQGAQRYAPGVQAARGKVERYAAELIPAQQAMLQTLESMPRGTFEQNMQRAFAFADMMREFGQRRRRG